MVWDFFWPSPTFVDEGWGYFMRIGEKDVAGSHKELPSPNLLIFANFVA